MSKTEFEYSANVLRVHELLKICCMPGDNACNCVWLL